MRGKVRQAYATNFSHLLASTMITTIIAMAIWEGKRKLTKK